MGVVKTVPHLPLSHPFTERLADANRRDTWTGLFFGTGAIWKRSWGQDYFNTHRV